MEAIGMNVSVPSAWEELTDQQLYYVYNLLADTLSAAQVETYCFFRFSGIRVIGRFGNGWEIARGKLKGIVSPGQIQNAIQQLRWLEQLPARPIRISEIKGQRAVDAQLRDLTFEQYLFCDNLYQGYLEKQDLSLLGQMAGILYQCDRLLLNTAEKINVFYWWASAKSFFSNTFTNFLQPMSTKDIVEDGLPLQRKLQQAMNAQIRALTGGDITKNRQVLEMDLWSALWELDAKAAEYNEIKQKYGKH